MSVPERFIFLALVVDLVSMVHNQENPELKAIVAVFLGLGMAVAMGRRVLMDGMQENSESPGVIDEM